MGIAKSTNWSPGIFVCSCGYANKWNTTNSKLKTQCYKCHKTYIGRLNSQTKQIDPIELNLEKLNITEKCTFIDSPLNSKKLKYNDIFDLPTINQLKFSNIKQNCVVKSDKRNTCNIANNTSCNQSNCVLYYFLKVLKGGINESEDNFQFTTYSKKCKVKTDNNRCSINSNRPCLAKNCVMFNFLKVIQNNVK